jgi:sec-independent protein translocase protein TatB
MEFLGVGPTELILIIIVALIVLGPKDLAKTSKTIGKWLNDLVRSDTWKAVQKTSKELRQLPTQLMREDNLERSLTEEKNPPSMGANAGTWSGKVGMGNPPPAADPTPAPKNEPTIHPPVTVDGPPASTLESVPPKPVAKPRKKPTTSKTRKVTPKTKSATRKKSNE